MYVDIESTCTYDVLEARLEKTKMEMWGLDLSIKELVHGVKTWIHNDMDSDYNPNDEEEEEAEEEERTTTNSETEVIDGDEREVRADDIHTYDIWKHVCSITEIRRIYYY